MRTPFIGRQTELEQLVALPRLARRERAPAAALMTGLPGSGKSRLLSEFVARSDLPPRVRLVGFEPLRSVPLAAAAHLLRELSSVPNHGRDIEELAFGAGDRQVRDALPIFEAAYRALASAGPLLLTVDDLQWVDEQSLGLLHYLLRAAVGGQLPLVIVAAARPSATAATMRQSLETGLPEQRRALVELGPLPLREGLLLIRALDSSVGELEAAAIWQRAGGSPFWLESLGRQSGAAGQRDPVDERLHQLGSDAGYLLAALAVGSRPFAEDDLREAVDWPHDRLRHAARELIDRGLVIESGGMLGAAHDLIREAALPTVAATTARRLHAAFARAIERRAGNDAQLLHEALRHRAAAGLPLGQLALRLVSSSQRRLLRSEDLKLLASISDALQDGSEQQLRLDEALGELAGLVGAADISLERWTGVADRTTGSRRQLAELAAGQAAYSLGHIDEARKHLAGGRASTSATQRSQEIGVRLDALEALVQLWLEHRTSVGSATAARALSTARLMESHAGGLAGMSRSARRAYLEALRAASDAALQEDRHLDLIELQTQVIAIAGSLGDDEQYVAAMTEAGRYSLWCGRVRDAERWFQRSWDAARRLVLPAAMVHAGLWLARSLQALGKLSDALRVAEETVELESRVGIQSAGWGRPAHLLHALELSLGDPARALHSLRQDAEAEHDPHYRIGLRQTMAEWLARFEGQPAARAVAELLQAARTDLAAVNCPRCGNELTVVSAEILARIGHPREAAAQLSEWEQRAGRQDDSMHLLWRKRALASIAGARGELDGALAQLEQLVEQAEQIGRMDHVVWARLDLGEVLAEVDRKRAIVELRRAASLAEHIGATSQYRLATRRLRRLGIRVWRREPPTHLGSPLGDIELASLSAREIEVSRLIARGQSNREIAQSLVISPKTVERHVSNILAKLGLRNRTALAALMRSTARVRDFPDDGGVATS